MATEETREHRQDSSPLATLSNAVVALHREHFGRGPAAARAFVVDGMAICVMSDIYSRVERTLIEAGRFDHVRQTRLLHHETLEASYAGAAEAALGRRVMVVISALATEPDVAVELFLLGERVAERDEA
jgi:uncharacterized protein YbcI